MKPIYTLDFETDPFEHGRIPHPFCAGMFDGQDFWSYWGRDVTRKVIARIKRLPAGVIYMHNGGRFDIYFLMKWLEAEMTIINGRIVEAKIGQHSIRDSYAIIPVPLKAYKKDDIDIDKLSRGQREQAKSEILSYLRGDCQYLHELVSGFVAEFGDFLTIASAAFTQLRKFHPIEAGSKYLDEKFRKQFFFGGRVQCFESGVIERPFKIYDVNSMYPYVMKNFLHPISTKWEVDREVRKNTVFVVGEGICSDYGCFPLRKKGGGIEFRSGRGAFSTTIHEWNAAIDCRAFRPTKILKTYGFDALGCFDEFVEHFYAARLKAQAEKDLMHKLFYKFILNSAYGKFAQDAERFADYAITHNQRMPSPWREKEINRKTGYVIWQKSASRYHWYNVATGASITGAARSVLLRAIAGASDPSYCDTDSIICGRLRQGTPLHDANLGAWKMEGSGTTLAIAGKKLYAAFDGDDCVKYASKGVRVSPEQIVRIAMGETILYKNPAPTFKLSGVTTFIERNVRRTV
jgi:Vibrio phage DNA polymerase